MQKYRLISKKGEGTFSEVLKAQSIKTGKYVAIKCMKNHFESIEQVSRRSIRSFLSNTLIAEADWDDDNRLSKDQNMKDKLAYTNLSLKFC